MPRFPLYPDLHDPKNAAAFEAKLHAIFEEGARAVAARAARRIAETEARTAVVEARRRMLAGVGR